MHLNPKLHGDNSVAINIEMGASGILYLIKMLIYI